MTNTSIVDLYSLQAELEKGMTLQGQEAYQRRVQKAQQQEQESETSYGRTLIAEKADVLAVAIAQAVEEANNGKPGRRHASLKYLAQVSPNVAAFIALKTVLNGISGQKPLVKVALAIGSMLEDEVRFSAIREEDEKWFKNLKKLADERGSYHNKRHLFVRSINHHEFDAPEWPALDKLRIGEKLIDLIVSSVGLVTVEAYSEGKTDTINFLRPTPELQKWIVERMKRDEVMCPFYEPMIVPPVEWTKMIGGGYLTRYVKRLKLVKTNLRGYMEEAANTEMPLVYRAVNAIQNVKWVVNTQVLEVMEQLWENGSTWATVPPKYDHPIPLCPICGGVVGTDRNHPCFNKTDPNYNEEKHTEWKSAARTTHNDNRELTSRRIQFYQALVTARKYGEFPVIYFPHTMDFRGRIYAVPQFNPQGPDFMKALLCFAEGKPLGAEGVKWLAIHGANLAGVDKVDFQARADWVVENEDQILAIAADPYGNRGWVKGTWLVEGEPKEMKIDKPWQFLSFCLEWAGFCREGEAFVSRIPIALDGSCSGIQNYSMALRDEVGGAAVNLTPSDKPQDVYALVQDVAWETITGTLAASARPVEEIRVEAQPLREEARALKARISEAEKAKDAGALKKLRASLKAVQAKLAPLMDVVLADQWNRFGKSRKVFKRPTMTYVYGSGQFGYKDQIMEDVLKAAKKEMGEAFPFDGDGFEAAIWMAGLIDKALPKVVVKAAEGMAWLRKAAKLLAAEGLPVHWHTPDGFPVQQARFAIKPMRVETVINGTRTRMNLNLEQQEIDPYAQANSISPNFIHSLDATHLRFTVVNCAEQGVDSLALIHDSFGTLAADTDALFRIVRESFVQMYAQVDVFECFHDEVREQLAPENRDQLLPPPKKGDLDLSLVLDSHYCFA